MARTRTSSPASDESPDEDAAGTDTPTSTESSSPPEAKAEAKVETKAHAGKPAAGYVRVKVPERYGAVHVAQPGGGTKAVAGGEVADLPEAQAKAIGAEKAK